MTGEELLTLLEEIGTGLIKISTAFSYSAQTSMINS